VCLEARGDIAAALANYRRAAALDPSTVDVVHAVAQALSKHGERAEALSAWTRLTAMEPRYMDFWVGLARERYAAEDFAGAMAACDRAIECAPHVGRLYWERLQIRGELQFQRAGAPDAPSGPLDDDELDLIDCDRAIQNGCRNARVYLYKADTLAQRGQPEAAVATLDEAAKEHPKDGEVFGWRSRYKRRLGDEAGGRADERRARKLGAGWLFAGERAEAP